jgi:hypothetical protein
MVILLISLKKNKNVHRVTCSEQLPSEQTNRSGAIYGGHDRAKWSTVCSASPSRPKMTSQAHGAWSGHIKGYNKKSSSLGVGDFDYSIYNFEFKYLDNLF